MGILVVGAACTPEPDASRAENHSAFVEEALLAPPEFPLSISPNARYLQDQAGNPFPILGRTAWFVVSLAQSDYEVFLDDTLARGYTAIELHVLNHDPRGNNAPRNGNGDLPFTRRLDGGNWSGALSYGNINNQAPDFTSPNEAYWSFVDAFLAACEERGLLVFFFPAYVGYAGGEQGWMQEMVANGTARMNQYGAYLAGRYQNQKNLVWMLGGDLTTFTQAQSNVHSALITGLKSVAGQSALYTALWATNTICADVPEFAAHCSLQGAYSWTGEIVTYGRRAYSHAPAAPAFLLEGPYDEEGADGNGYNLNATQPVRRFAWWGWLSTIGGYFAGNGYVWLFTTGWDDHLDTQASQDDARLNAFVRSLAWHDLIPSGLSGMKTLITSGGGSTSSSSYVAAAAAASGETLVAYVPPTGIGTRSFSVDMTAMGGAARARWFNPTTGAYIDIASSLPNTGSRSFTTPGNNGTGSNDWVLLLSRIVASAPPTVVTPAAANPNPVAGSTTNLSVLGGDDAGETTLSYTWAAIGTPPGPISFSVNGTNASKNTIASFGRAGAYTLRAAITDAEGQSVSSTVSVTVQQTPGSVVVAPASASVAPNATQQFVATQNDQFGVALSVQPTFTWAVSGGGTISSSGLFTAGTAAGGPFTVTAGAAGTSGTASVSVVSAPPVHYRVNSGGGAVSPFVADQLFAGGTAYSSASAVSTSGVANAAPAAVYQTERYGNHTYTFTGLTAGSSYVVRLHFAEIYWTTAGSRLFNVSINGSQVLGSFDIVATAGAFKAVVRDFSATANGTGRIVIQYTTVRDNAKSSGIEVFSSAPRSAPPTIASGAAALPNPTAGTTTSLSVLGADDGGEGNLRYTWSVTGTPPAPVTFSANGTNAAKTVNATFTRAGVYGVLATILDLDDQAVTSTASVTVSQALTSITISPPSGTVVPGGTLQFTAAAKDQFGNDLATQPQIAWMVSGGGTISATGLFTAGSSPGGPFTVTASSGGVSRTASVTVSSSPPVLIQINSGSGAAGSFVADRSFSGGTAYASSNAINTTGVTSPAPQAVYQTERYGNFTYTITGLTPGASHTVRLHFAEIYWTAAGSRLFNVTINGSPRLSNFDVFVAAGGANRANVQQFTIDANASGQLVIQFTTIRDNAKVSGIEIIRP